MSTYNQMFIDAVGEDEVIGLIKNHGLPIIKGDIFNFETNKKFIALDHYLTKQIESGSYPIIIEDCIKQRYKDFQDKPWIFVNSPLLKNSTINKIQGKEKIFETRDNYYNYYTFLNLYQQSLKRELSEQEKNQLYAYYIHNLNTTNEKLQEVIKYEIGKIIDSKMPPSKMNTTQLQFYAQYIINDIFKSYAESAYPTQTIPIITVGQGGGVNGSQKNCVININKKNYDDNIESFTHTIFHEYRHSMQEKELVSSDKDMAFEMAYQKLFYKYLNTPTFDCYYKNYGHMGIEIDAEKMGFHYAKLFFESFGRKDLSKKLNEKAKKMVGERQYYPLMTKADGKKVQLDDYIVYNLDKIIKNHPEELNNYPVLNTIYNGNGEKKDFFELLEERSHAHVDYRNKFSPYINKDIADNKLDNIDLERDLGIDKARGYLPMFSTMFIEKEMAIFNYLNDITPTKKYNFEGGLKEADIINTTAYQIKLANKMMEFVNKNFDFLSTLSNEYISAKIELSTYIRNANNLTVSNPILKNNELINSLLDDYKKTQTELLNKYDALYHKKEEVTEEPIEKSPFDVDTLPEIINPALMEGNMKLPNGTEIPTKQYIQEIVYPQLPKSETITLDNGAVLPVKQFIEEMVMYDCQENTVILKNLRL